MDDRKHSISLPDLHARLGSEAAPIIVEVRRDADCVGADTRLADAFHGSPDALYTWCRTLQAESHNWPARAAGA
jgi:hypothetical protein